MVMLFVLVKLSLIVLGSHVLVLKTGKYLYNNGDRYEGEFYGEIPNGQGYKLN